MISRVERTRFAAWWWTVDRLMLGAIAVPLRCTPATRRSLIAA